MLHLKCVLDIKFIYEKYMVNYKDNGFVGKCMWRFLIYDCNIIVCTIKKYAHVSTNC